MVETDFSSELLHFKFCSEFIHNITEHLAKICLTNILKIGNILN